MTTLKKIGLSTALALVVGAGIYEVRENWIRNNDARAMHQRLDALLLENRELRARSGEVNAKLAGAEAELASARALATAGDPAIESALEAWLERVQTLKGWLEKMPDKRIPQMALLTADDWLGAAKTARVDSEFGARKALADLRRDAMYHFSTPLRTALRGYVKVHGDRLPPSAAELASYFEPSVDLSMLQNFEIIEMTGLKLIEENGKASPTHTLANKIVDEIYDVRVGFTVAGNSPTQMLAPTQDTVYAAVRSFRKANNGQSPQNAAQLVPYLEKPVDNAYLEYVFRDLVK